MLCPLCRVELQMAERQGVEIDYCPQCRGVWLDRGELDKIIDRSTQTDGASYEPPRDDDRRSRHHGGKKHGNDNYGTGRRKRGGFLGELFDFD